MPSHSKFRCVITVDGHPRRLFSVAERRDGDLMITLMAAPYYREAGNPIVRENLVESQKYSVHMSSRSEYSINALHHTLRTTDVVNHPEHHFTEAIKQYQQFALLYAARLADPRENHYIPGPGERETLNLGEYDPEKGTLHYAVFVAASGREFDSAVPSGMHVAQKTFREFKILILWEVTAIPSCQYGVKVHPHTMPLEAIPEADRAVMKNLVAGCTAAECVNLFAECKEIMMQELFSTCGVE